MFFYGVVWEYVTVSLRCFGLGLRDFGLSGRGAFCGDGRLQRRRNHAMLPCRLQYQGQTCNATPTVCIFPLNHH